MPTPKSVSDIKSKLLRPSLTSHFEVSIGIPPFLSGSLDVYSQERLHLQCSETSLPGSRLTTFEINNDHHGVTERHAYRRMFDDRIDLSFYVDADNYGPIRFFETWMRGIVDEDDLVESSNTSSDSRNYFYRARYPDGPDGYCTDGLEITKFERDYKSNFLTYKFIKAYPFSINSMPISYDGSNLLKCTVGFSYIRYVTDKVIRPRSESQSGTANTTPIQQAQFNASNLTLPGLDGAGALTSGTSIPLTTGGVPKSVANSSGNSVTLSSGTSIPLSGQN